MRSNLKKRPKQPMPKKNNLIFLLIVACLLSIFIASCDNRSGGIIPSRKMENLLVDMHVLEGSMRATGNYNLSGEESRLYYAALFEKYGVTVADFDSSLVWYTKHPKKFERIYVNVMSRIDSLSSDIRNGKYHPVDSSALSGEINLWTRATRYVLTKDSARTELSFEIENVELLPNDFYTLSFLHRVAPSDSSRNPHAVLYVNYANDVVDSIYTKTRNDSVLRRYTLIFKARKNLKINSLSGYLLGNDSSLGKMNASLDSIKLIRRYNPYKQDSIRAVILKMDSASVAGDSLAAVSKDSVKSGPKDSLKTILKDSVIPVSSDTAKPPPKMAPRFLPKKEKKLLQKE